MKSWLLGALLTINVSSALAGSTLDLTKPLHEIAFGSCAMQFKPQPIWSAIADQTPR